MVVVIQRVVLLVVGKCIVDFNSHLAHHIYINKGIKELDICWLL